MRQGERSGTAGFFRIKGGRLNHRGQFDGRDGRGKREAVLDLYSADPPKVSVQEYGVTTVVCPRCGQRMAIDCSDHLRAEGNVKIRHSCSCGHSHTVLLERRRQLRKRVFFSGSFRPQDASDRYAMVVKDLSRLGIKCQLAGNPPVSVGDRLNLIFRLDDSTGSVVERDAVVRYVRDGHAGMEFHGTPALESVENGGDQAISAYLFT